MRSGSKSISGPMRNASKSIARLFEVMGIFLLLAGCLNPGQKSDWQWKQFNPEYRQPYPEDPRPGRGGIF